MIRLAIISIMIVQGFWYGISQPVHKEPCALTFLTNNADIIMLYDGSCWQRLSGDTATSRMILHTDATSCWTYSK